MFANCIHAAGESSDRVRSGTIAVGLTAENERELIELSAKLSELEVPHKLICEADGRYRGQCMAIGIEPSDDRFRIAKVTGGLPTVK